MVQCSSGDPHQVMLVDGAAMLISVQSPVYRRPPDRSGATGPGGRHVARIGEWCVVGCLLGEPVASGGTCPGVELQGGNCNGMLQLDVFPASILRNLVGLVRSQPGVGGGLTDRSGASESWCYVVDPNENFLMIPLTPGVMRTSTGGRGKVLEMLQLHDLRMHMLDGRSGDSNRNDRDHCNASGLLGMTNPAWRWCVEAMSVLWSLKPQYQQPRNIKPELLCKELLPGGSCEVTTP